MFDAELYWIDALCIDQDDLSERSIQVTLMGAIYSQAQRTFIWLGEGDKYTRRAMQLITKMWLSARNQLKTMSLEPSSVTKFINMDDLEDNEVVALAAFMVRTWFSRIWVLQVGAVPNSYY